MGYFLLLTDEEQDILEFATRLKKALNKSKKAGIEIPDEIDYCIGGLWEVIKRLNWAKIYKNMPAIFK